MRRFVYSGILGNLFWATASLGQPQSSGPVTTSPTAERADGIAVSESSSVCVTVNVDQRIWPQPLAPDSAQIISGSLMAELRNLYERRGGSVRFPNSHSRPRFVTNEHGNHPDCQDNDTDVLVIVNYGPRADGTAFIVDYRIGRGAVSRTDRTEINVAAEIRAGRIRGFTRRRTMTAVIYDDLLSRAPMIVDQLDILRQ